MKLHDEFFPLLDLLAMVLNPANKFHCYNASRPSEFKLPPPPKTSQRAQESDADSTPVNNRNRNEDPGGRNDDDAESAEKSDADEERCDF